MYSQSGTITEIQLPSAAKTGSTSSIQPPWQDTAWMTGCAGRITACHLRRQDLHSALTMQVNWLTSLSSTPARLTRMRKMWARLPGHIRQRWEMIRHWEPEAENSTMDGDRCQERQIWPCLEQSGSLPLMWQKTRYSDFLDMAVKSLTMAAAMR